MANVIVKFKIMPQGVEVPLEAVEKEAKKIIENFGALVHKMEKQPVAFGLVAIIITFMYDEKRGTTDKLEEDITAVEGVGSVEVIDCRRAFG